MKENRGQLEYSSYIECYVTGGTSANVRNTESEFFLHIAHSSSDDAMETIRDTSALSEPPEGAGWSKLEWSPLCFALSFSCKDEKLGAHLSIDRWVRCADYTGADHHYVFMEFWQIQ